MAPLESSRYLRYKLNTARSALANFLARKLKRNFYLYLACALSAFAVLDVLFLHQIVEMREKSYDLMIRNRIIQPKPDPAIVIVDIDEASLAAMAADYGRWPWPRQVFGEFVERLEAQKPKTIVFDILFSDPDIFNSDSDNYFNEVVATNSNLFFHFCDCPKNMMRSAR